MGGHESTGLAPESPNRRRSGMSDEPTLVPGTESPADEDRRTAGVSRSRVLVAIAIAVVAVVILVAVVGLT